MRKPQEGRNDEDRSGDTEKVKEEASSASVRPQRESHCTKNEG